MGARPLPVVSSWEHWRQASERLDYFLLGVSAALTTYLGQHLAKPSIGVNGPTLELLTLGLWAFATAAGNQGFIVSNLGVSIQLTDALVGARTDGSLGVGGACNAVTVTQQGSDPS